MTLRSCLTLAAALLISVPAAAQETTEVPEHKAYLAMCMEMLEPKTRIELAASVVVCQCHYEQLPHDTMTEAQVEAGLVVCKNEAQRDPVSFTEKYLERAEEAVR